ncbi:MAG: ABC transporter permease, partial [Candidatus Aminicenantaceae bacterium]
MLKSYLKIAFRNIKRHKGFSFINITGLAIGITACLLLFLWVQDELSYDRYHEKAGRIYRVLLQYEVEGRFSQSATTSAPLAPALLNEFPEILNSVRFGRNGFIVSYQNKRFIEEVFFADPQVFDFFTFPLIKG